MRGQLQKIVLVAAVCLPSDRFVFAQAVPSPTVTTTITPTAAPTSSPGPSPTPSPGPPSMPSGSETVERQRGSDAAFMTRVELRGLEAVELARIAAGRASTTSVRALGQQILQDRGKANDELRLFARGEAITLPAILDASRQAEVDRVSRLSPPALDRAIVLAMVRISDADVADFQKQTDMGQEVELQGWVYDTLPLLEEQRDEIRRIAAELGISLRSGQ
jgi:predicted outer membrane protein